MVPSSDPFLGFLLLLLMLAIYLFRPHFFFFSAHPYIHPHPDIAIQTCLYNCMSYSQDSPPLLEVRNGHHEEGLVSRGHANLPLDDEYSPIQMKKLSASLQTSPFSSTLLRGYVAVSKLERWVLVFNLAIPQCCD